MPIVKEPEALQYLQNGEPVALPTETVYGLAAPINNEAAIKKIFTIKARPFFDPLIVHVAELNHALLLAQWDPLSTALAKKFWPGPLTLVLPKDPAVSDLITAGLTTVGLRCPMQPQFQNLLQGLNVPLAAPSANRFGKMSPTNAKDVVEEFKDKVPVVDGGQCRVGIESTVVEVEEAEDDGWIITILRPGIISPNDLEKAAEDAGFTVEIEIESKVNSPGHLKNHYQPDVPLVLVEDSVEWTEKFEQVIQKYFNSYGKVEWLRLATEPEIAARELYGQLRALNNQEPALICARYNKNWKNEDKWRALEDRLQKASSLVAELNDQNEVILHS